jgi:hypothetical protein
MCFELEEIIELNDYGGNFTNYEDAIHQIYLDIFRNPSIYFKGKMILPITFPRQHKNRHWTFSHMTSTGNGKKGNNKKEIEDNRELDLRRCERITWVKQILQNLNKDCLKIWRERRNSKNRIVIWHEKMDFALVLQEESKVYRLVTTFNTAAPKYRTDNNNAYKQYISDLASGKAKPL